MISQPEAKKLIDHRHHPDSPANMAGVSRAGPPKEVEPCRPHTTQ